MHELDILLGRFADARLAGLASEELDTFEALLEIPDQELYRWIADDAVPAAFRSPLLSALIAFHERP